MLQVGYFQEFSQLLQYVSIWSDCRKKNLSQAINGFFQVSKISADFDFNSMLCIIIGFKYKIYSTYPVHLVICFVDAPFALLTAS